MRLNAKTAKILRSLARAESKGEPSKDYDIKTFQKVAFFDFDPGFPGVKKMPDKRYAFPYLVHTATLKEKTTSGRYKALKKQYARGELKIERNIA